jgi:tRNA pseudouridine55 synthase
VLGALLVDKPSGPTSHDIVAFVRRALSVDKAGHTGTLDPLATGLLIVLVGSATRLAQFVAADDKEYVADVRLGLATPTYDRASIDAALAEVGSRRVEVGKSAEEIEAVLARFRGTFRQTPPPYSAKKIASVPAYEKARKNQPVELRPVEVTVRRLEIVSTSDLGLRQSPLPIADRPPATSDATLLRLRVESSAGFYVRSLAHDIGQALGCGAHLEALRRTRIGRFRVDEALTLDRVESEGTARIVSANDLLGHMTAVTVTEDDARRIAHGNPVKGQTEVRPGPDLLAAGNHLRLLDSAGQLLAVAERRPGGLLQPVVVLR